MEERDDFVTVSISGPVAAVTKLMERWFMGEDVAVDTASPFLRYKSFVVDPDKNVVAAIVVGS